MVSVIEATVLEKKMITEDLGLFRLAARVPNFEPGQFMMVGLHVDGRYIKRPYSIASTPSAKDHLEFCIKSYPQGRFAKHALRLNEGDKVKLEGPYGKFILNGSPKDKIFIAAGTGIAPIVSMVRTLLERGFGSSMRLFYGVSYPQTLVYSEELETHAQKHKNFEFVPTVSREAPEWKGERGRVETILSKYIHTSANTEAYVCGPPPMVQNVVTFLRSVGFDAKGIHTEQYW